MSRPLVAAESHAEAGVEVAHVSIARVGEDANGDRAVCRWGLDKRVLFGIIDGLGHGSGADEVATLGADYLSTVPLNVGLREIMEGLHARLSGTRGAAATICVVAYGKVEACAVGNVEMRCAETPVPLMVSPGILGVRVQRLRVCEAPLKPNTRVVMFSDGVSTRLRCQEVRKVTPRDACMALIDRFRRYDDDATVLIADVE